MIKKLKKFIYKNDLDGYIIPKNDKYFTEYSNVNNLSKISKFTGSAGFAIVLKKRNYLFVDGRYTLQANKQCGDNFQILELPHILPKNLNKLKNIKIGFDPKLFTESTLDNYFQAKVNLIPIEFKFEDKHKKKSSFFYHLNKSVTGENSNSKIKRVKKYLKKEKINYLYISASENVNWLLNIRGKDLPNSPIANCKLIITDDNKLYFFSNLRKLSNFNQNKFKNIVFCEENTLLKVISKFRENKFAIDRYTCSLFEEKIISSIFKIVSKIDPIYDLKAVKNSTEIKNTYKAHIEDGVAVTKFLYWFKNNKKIKSEKKIEKKLEELRKLSKNYLYPSFDTIAGSGPNGAIIHYKSNNKTNRQIKRNDILLVDSGGQYKWGTTDITRTICCGKISNKIKDNFTRVLKGHIAVVTYNLNNKTIGKFIDRSARKFLNKVGLDYAHGTGHGVGFFLNVHEGPQGISKYNKVILKKGMILSNEPGYYHNNHYGIRIENLIYIAKYKNNLFFKNLTHAPIDTDMINFGMLNKKEKKYLFNYHLEVYSQISKYLNKSERKWLINLIK